MLDKSISLSFGVEVVQYLMSDDSTSTKNGNSHYTVQWGKFGKKLIWRFGESEKGLSI